MGFNCSRSSCCFCCFYQKCFRVCCCFGKNKTGPSDAEKSPPPSIALTMASQLDDVSIQEQLSLFHFGQKSPGGASGRRYSHPNQAKWVEEYERRKSNPGSPSPSLPMGEPPDTDPTTPPPLKSPVMEYPVVPPGIPYF